MKRQRRCGGERGTPASDSGTCGAGSPRASIRPYGGVQASWRAKIPRAEAPRSRVPILAAPRRRRRLLPPERGASVMPPKQPRLEDLPDAVLVRILGSLDLKQR